jgi:Zn-dependent membrane protease YugP
MIYAQLEKYRKLFSFFFSFSSAYSWLLLPHGVVTHTHKEEGLSWLGIILDASRAFHHGTCTLYDCAILERIEMCAKLG